MIAGSVIITERCLINNTSANNKIFDNSILVQNCQKFHYSLKYYLLNLGICALNILNLLLHASHARYYATIDSIRIHHSLFTIMTHSTTKWNSDKHSTFFRRLFPPKNVTISLQHYKVKLQLCI